MIPLSAALALENQSFHAQVLAALKPIPVRIVLDQVGFGAWNVFREKLERLQPDVVLVDLAGQPEERFSYVQQIRVMSRPPAVVVIHDVHDAATILSAMRAGAAEFLTLPLEEGALSAALERISALVPGRPAGPQSGGTLLAFLAAKGGAGSTTLACNVSATLAKSTGKEVLLADLDIETGNVAFAMKAPLQHSILDACRNISRLDPHYWRGLVSNGQPNLSLLTAPAEPYGLTPPEGVEIRQVLRFVRSLYRFTVVDLASSLNRQTLAVLEDADRIFLVSTTDLPSLHQAKRVLQALLRPGFDAARLSLVLNRTSRRDEVTPEDIQRNLGVPVMWNFPSDAESVKDFYVKGELPPPGSALGRSVRQFVNQISGAEPAPAKKKSFLGL